MLNIVRTQAAEQEHGNFLQENKHFLRIQTLEKLDYESDLTFYTFFVLSGVNGRAVGSTD